MRRNEIDIDAQLERTVDLPHSPFDAYFTKTTMFMLPAVGLKRKQMPDSFVNAFLRDEHHTHLYTCPIFLLFKVSGEELKTPLWRSWHNSMKAHPDYVHYYIAGRSNGTTLVVYVLELAEDFHEDYSHFQHGEYSKFSAKFRSLFFPFIVQGTEQVPNAAYQVIHKDPVRKAKLEQLLDTYLDDDVELLNPPDLEGRELLRWPEAETSPLIST